MTLNCKNIKVTIVLRSHIDIRLVEQKCFISKKKTSTNFRHHELSCVFTIYNHDLRSLHITGINQICMISQIIEFIKFELENCVELTSIDNSLFTSKQDCFVPLNDIIRKVNDLKSSPYFCVYIPEIFPALFLKPIQKDKKSGVPSIILFHNSSYVIIGGKCMEKVKEANAFVKTICCTLQTSI